MENLLNDSRRYLLSVILDNLGGAIIAFVLPLIVISTNNSVISLSIISSLSVAPFLILGLPFGALIDRLNIKKILYISDFIRFISFFIMAVLLSYVKNQEILMISIYIFSILSSCVNVMSSIAETTYTPRLVSTDQGLAKMNSSIYGIQYIVGIAAPIIGGAIYGRVLSSYIFIFSSFCFLASSLILLSLRKESPVAEKLQEKSISKTISMILNDIVQGYRNIRVNQDIFYPLIIVAFFNVLTANFSNDSLIIMKNIISFSPVQIGLVTSIASIGALLGIALVGILSKKISFYRFLFSNMVLQLSLRFIFFMATDIFWVTLSLFMIDVFQSILNIIIIINRQKNIEKEFLGRANRIYKTVLIGVNTVGYLLGGTISKAIGSREGILLSCAGIVILVIISSLFVQRSIEK